MVFTSASIRPTALLQLTHLIVGQRTSAPAVELGHLAVQPQTRAVILPQLGHVSLTIRAGTAAQPPTGRGLVALLRW
jgi:hypothetical protein